MRAYVTPNLCESARARISTLFSSMAALFELFLFVYIGLTLFLQQQEFSIWRYMVRLCVADRRTQSCCREDLSLSRCNRLIAAKVAIEVAIAGIIIMFEQACVAV
jgi:hypothetical protein